MSAIVLRCPNCGKTRATLGECEVCREVQVRYYCTTHSPGRWLDTPACPQCGAHFDDPMGAPVQPASAAPTRQPAQPAPAVPRRMAGPSSSAGPGPLPPSAGRPIAGEGLSRAPERLLSADYEETGVRDTCAPLGANWRNVYRRTAKAPGDPPEAVFDRETAPPVKRRPGGRMVRFLLILVLMFLALMGGMYMIGAALLRLFLPF